MVEGVVVLLICASADKMKSGVMLLSGAWKEVMVKGVMRVVVLLVCASMDEPGLELEVITMYQ